MQIFLKFSYSGWLGNTWMDGSHGWWHLSISISCCQLLLVRVSFKPVGHPQHGVEDGASPVDRQGWLTDTPALSRE